MFQVTTTGDTAQIETGSRLVPIGAIFFLGLGLLDIVLGFVTGHPGNVLGPGIACVVFGAIYGFVPYKTVVKIDRGLGEMTRTSRALFRGETDTEKLDELQSITISPGTYNWFFYAKRKNGGSLRLFGQMKMTWTWTTKPTPDVVARGQEVATALGVPLSP